MDERAEVDARDREQPVAAAAFDARRDDVEHGRAGDREQHERRGDVDREGVGRRHGPSVEVALSSRFRDPRVNGRLPPLATCSRSSCHVAACCSAGCFWWSRCWWARDSSCGRAPRPEPPRRRLSDPQGLHRPTPPPGHRSGHDAPGRLRGRCRPASGPVSGCPKARGWPTRSRGRAESPARPILRRSTWRRRSRTASRCWCGRGCPVAVAASQGAARAGGASRPDPARLGDRRAARFPAGNRPRDYRVVFVPGFPLSLATKHSSTSGRYCLIVTPGSGRIGHHRQGGTMATTDATATEQAAIEQAIQLYIDGASKGDAAKLKETFHEAAWMLGSIGGQRFDMPIAQMIETLAAQPLDSTASSAPGSLRSSRSATLPLCDWRKTAAGATSPSSTSSPWQRSTARGRSSTRHSPTRAGRCRRASSRISFKRHS